MKLDITPDQIDGLTYDWEMTQQQLAEWAEEHVEVWTKAVAMIGPALAIAGVCLGAKHTLRVYIAQSQAPAPTKILPATANPDGTIPNPSRSQRAFRFLRIVSIIGCLEGLLLFVLPAFPAWADGFWIVMAMAYGFLALFKVASILHPSSLRLTRTMNGRYVLTRVPGDPLSTSVRHAFAVGFCSGFKPFALTAFINLWLLSSIYPTHALSSPIYGQLIGAAITASMVSRFQGPKLRMKVLVAFLGMYPILFLGPRLASKSVEQGDFDVRRMLVELVAGGAQGPAGARDVFGMEKGIFGASDEVTEMLATVGKAVLMGVPGWFAAIALRFDHSIHLASDANIEQNALTLTSAPLLASRNFLQFPRCTRFAKNVVPDCSGVILPSTLPAFKKPMFRAVIVTITAVWIGLWGVAGVREWVGICAFSLPVISIVMMLNAARMGVSKEFWGYTENWWLEPTPVEELTHVISGNVIDIEKAQIAAFAQTQAGANAVHEDKLVDVDA